MADKVQKIREEVERLRSLHQIKYQHLDTNDNMCLVECSMRNLCNDLLLFIDSLQEEPVSVWHDASEEPNDMSHCLIFYGCKESVGHYVHYEPVLYNKKEKVFVTSSFPHPTGYKVEQKSFDGGCVAEVYKNKRDRISISDITQWCYLKDLHNLSNVERIGKDWKEEPVSDDLEEVAEAYALDDYIKPWRELVKRAFKAGANWQKTKDESTTEDLGKYINELSKQFPDVSFAKLSRIAVRVSRWQRNQDVKNKLPKVISRTDLDEYAYQCAYDMSNDWMIDNPTWNDVEDACKLGAKWQEKQDQSTIELAEDHAMLAGMEKMKEQIMKNLWKPADGDDLPEYDREVIVLTQPYPLEDSEYAVYFAHRPDPKGWDGKSITTGEVEHYTPKTYDKGGWNIPDIKWWLDVELPKEIKL